MRGLFFYYYFIYIYIYITFFLVYFLSPAEPVPARTLAFHHPPAVSGQSHLGGGDQSCWERNGEVVGGSGWGRGAHPKHPPPAAQPSGRGAAGRGGEDEDGDTPAPSPVRQEPGANKLKSTNSSSETPRGEAAASLPSPRACGNVFCVP